MDNTKDCMLEKITSFLIRVGEHCMKCEGKPIIEPLKPVKLEKTKKEHTPNIKLCYLEKWVQTIGYDVFTLEQFFKDYPMQRKNKKLDYNISRLIADKKISQLDKNKFKVIKK